MKKYEEFLKRGNDIQNAFAIEYLLDYGRRNLLIALFLMTLL